MSDSGDFLVFTGGKLFTRDFLIRGIVETDLWRATPPETIRAFADAARSRLAPHADAGLGDLNEANTEDKIVKPLIAALGWGEDYSAQEAAARTGRSDVPDLLLFADAAAAEAARRERRPDKRYALGLAFVESKKWHRPLDRRDGTAGEGIPSSQMIRYLGRVSALTENRVTWGILTNGRLWRLYWAGAPSISEDYFEIDLALLLDLPGMAGKLFRPDAETRDHWLKVFYLMFGRVGFRPDASGRSFHALAREEGKIWEARIRENLADLVFARIFPALGQALYRGDPARPARPDAGYLRDLRQATLILLYRLLFVFYAEDRDLLPARDPAYDDYSLRKLRADIRRRIDMKDVFAEDIGRYYGQLRQLFRAIDKGSASLGLPPYNGGLFDSERTPFLERVEIGDRAMAEIVDGLSRPDGLWVNYRDLSVQQLGSIYEGLLEYDFAIGDKDAIAVRPNPFARKSSGSYYTPDDLVRLVIRQALDPTIAAKRDYFAARLAALGSDRRAKAERLRDLAAADPGRALLDLKICDPAMGSGHFLVDLVDYLADRVIEATEAASASAAAAGFAYESPLFDEIAAIRDRIAEAAQAGKWKIDLTHLDDKLILRRMILKRVVHGVDKNPMAVELAKVSLWLHTFTVGAPLSFLDHHLRCGDSLFGEWVRPVLDEMRETAHLLFNPYIQQARNAAGVMARIEDATDTDIGEVAQSARHFAAMQTATRALTDILDLRQALRWLGFAGLADHPALLAIFGGQRGDLDKALSADLGPGDEAADRQALDAHLEALRAESGKGKGRIKTALSKAETERIGDIIIRLARAMKAREHFLHWQAAFPNIWSDWLSAETQGGFDLVIGNPPWDRIKLQEVEYFAARRPEIAHAQTAAQRKKAIAALEKSGDPLYGDYLAARRGAETMAEIARENGHYPLLSGGDINLYSLFVERALSLLKPEGIAGLIVPSGIAADKTASAFFSSIAVSGRLGALFDFENKGKFFPDIDSRFKFCVLVMGGKARRFAEARCAFFLHDVAGIEDPERCFPLSPADFAAVNPNTGTAPIFRSRRDARLTADLYARHPILVDRRKNPPLAQWPVKYTTMFHMANDSHLFKTAEELGQDGFYPVDAKTWKKGSQAFRPLYVGRMINQFDHRFGGVEYAPENVLNRFVGNVSAGEEKTSPDFFPRPLFWVEQSEMPDPGRLNWMIGFRDIARTTDVRTAIASILPRFPAGHTLPLLLPRTEAENSVTAYIQQGPVIVANMNAIVFDYVLRQKSNSTHLTWFILEQLPVIASSAYATKIGEKSAEAIIRAEVLRLTYTAHDMAPFAKDQGYEGPPFPWDEAARRHARARLDALYFLLYGLTEVSDIDHILSTFPILREEDEKTFGRYLTRDLIIGYWRAFKAGDSESRIAE